MSINQSNITKSSRFLKNNSLMQKNQKGMIEVASGELIIERQMNKQPSKNNVQFELQLDDTYSAKDLRNSLHKKNLDMIQVYL